MRLREPPEWVGIPIAVVILTLASPVIAVLAAWFGLIWLKRQALGPGEQWQRWFAWHPVSVDFGDTRWLEMVERQSFAILNDTHYRALQPEPQP